ncbi:MAG: sigma-70 family RNA polymerase sigma factor [Jatrophihabitans sp.]
MSGATDRARALDAGFVDPELRLARAFCDGTDWALRAAYDQYSPLVFRIARQCLPSTTEAEEITQNTFVSAWRGRDTYDPGRGSLAGWLVGIARRRTIDRLRVLERERRDAVAAETTVSAEQIPTHADLVVDRIVMSDGLAELPDAQRRVLELAFFDDLTHQ